MLTLDRDGLSDTDGPRPDTDDALALLPLLGEVVALAPGLTVGAAARALAPWSPFLSLALGVDVGVWLSELGRGQIRDAARGAPEASSLHGVVLHPVATLYADGGLDHLSIAWELAGVDAAGAIYALPPDPFGWAGLPLVLDERAVLRDQRTGWRAAPDGRWRIEATLADAILWGFLQEVSAYGPPETAREVDGRLRAQAAAIAGRALDAATGEARPPHGSGDAIPGPGGG